MSAIFQITTTEPAANPVLQEAFLNAMDLFTTMLLPVHIQ